MDNPNVLIIVTAVALVLMIYVIRYIISRVLHKGADAIENRIRQVHSEKHPAENQSLAERCFRALTPHRTWRRRKPDDRYSVQLQKAVGIRLREYCLEPEKLGDSVPNSQAFCAKCGAELKKN